MDAIATWLQSPVDYFAGLELLKQTSVSSFTLSVLATGPDSFNTNKLYAELEKVHQLQLEKQVLKETQKPAELEAKEQDAGKLMDTRAELKAQLRMIMDDPGAKHRRKDIAFQIIAIGKQLDEIFTEKEFYNEHGYLPSGAFETDDDPVKLKARQSTLRTYIVRYSKPGTNETKLKEYQEELQIVNKKLEKYAV